MAIQSTCELRAGFAVTGPKQCPRSPPILVWPGLAYIDAVPFVPLRAKDNWLCTFLTGASSKKRPLTGIDLPGMVRDAIRDCASNTSSGSTATDLGLVLQKGTTHAKKPSGHYGKVYEVDVPPPPGAPAGAPPHRLRCTLLKGTRGAVPAVELCPENLKWLYETANAPAGEKRHRKNREPHAPDWEQRPTGLVWSRTENAWICRGPTSTKRFRIPTTTPSGEQWDISVYRTMMATAREAAASELLRQQSMTSSSDASSAAGHRRGGSRDSFSEVGADDLRDGAGATVTESPPEARDVSQALDSDMGERSGDDEEAGVFGGMAGLSGEESD